MTENADFVDDSCTARHFVLEDGRLVEIPEHVANARMLAPAAGVYDDEFRERFPEHQRRSVRDWREGRLRCRHARPDHALPEHHDE